MSTPFEIIASTTGSEDVARRVLKSLSAAGFVCVPREATEEMVEAGWAAVHGENTKDAWGDMIERALSTQAKEGSSDGRVTESQPY